MKREHQEDNIGSVYLSQASRNGKEVNSLNNYGKEEQFEYLLTQSKEYYDKNIELYMHQIKQLINSRQFEKATTLLELMCNYQNLYNLWVLQGKCAFQIKDYYRACYCFSQSFSGWKAQNDFNIHYHYGISLLKINHLTDAENAFKTAMELDKNHKLRHNILIYQAIIQRNNFQYYKSIELFIKALQNPDYNMNQIIQILCNIVLCLEASNQPKEMNEVISKALELDNKNADILKCKSWQLFCQGEYSEVLRHIQEIDLYSQEQDFDCLFMKAKSMEAQGKMKEALNFFNMATKLNPFHAVAFCSVGISFYKCNLPKDAFNAFHRAFMIDPSLQESLYNMAILYEQQKSYGEAVRIYEDMLRVDPNDNTVITRKKLIENNQTDKLQDFDLREPKFKCRIPLWLEQTNEQNVNQNFNQKRIPINQHRKKTSEDFIGIGFEDYHDINYFPNRARQNSLLAATPTLGPNPLYDQSPMNGYTFLDHNNQDFEPSQLNLDNNNEEGEYNYLGANDDINHIRKQSTSYLSQQYQIPTNNYGYNNAKNAQNNYTSFQLRKRSDNFDDDKRNNRSIISKLEKSDRGDFG